MITVIITTFDPTGETIACWQEETVLYPQLIVGETHLSDFRDMCVTRIA
jgi:hypothetical protein